MYKDKDMKHIVWKHKQRKFLAFIIVPSLNLNTDSLGEYVSEGIFLSF